MHNITAGTKLPVFSLKHKNNAYEQYSLKSNSKCCHCIVKANLDKSVDSIQRINKTSRILKYSDSYFDFFQIPRVKELVAKVTQDTLFQTTCNLFCYRYSKQINN